MQFCPRASARCLLGCVSGLSYVAVRSRPSSCSPHPLHWRITSFVHCPAPAPLLVPNAAGCVFLPLTGHRDGHGDDMGGGPSRRGRGGGRGGRGLARQNSANRKHRVRKEGKPSVIVILSVDRTAAPRRARTVAVRSIPRLFCWILLFSSQRVVVVFGLL